jgi:hypothetical protein
MEITLFKGDERKERFLVFFIHTTPTYNFVREYFSSEY